MQILLTRLAGRPYHAYEGNTCRDLNLTSCPHSLSTLRWTMQKFKEAETAEDRLVYVAEALLKPNRSVENENAGRPPPSGVSSRCSCLTALPNPSG